MQSSFTKVLELLGIEKGAKKLKFWAKNARALASKATIDEKEDVIAVSRSQDQDEEQSSWREQD